MKDSRQGNAPMVDLQVMCMSASNENARRYRGDVGFREWAQVTGKCADGEVMEKMRESHRGMVDGCRWSGGGMGNK